MQLEITWFCECNLIKHIIWLKRKIFLWKWRRIVLFERNLLNFIKHYLSIWCYMGRAKRITMSDRYIVIKFSFGKHKRDYLNIIFLRRKRLYERTWSLPTTFPITYFERKQNYCEFHTNLFVMILIFTQSSFFSKFLFQGIEPNRKPLLPSSFHRTSIETATSYFW